MAAPSPLSEALAAGVGGVVSTLILYPVELIKNKMQATVQGPVIFQQKKISSGSKTSYGTSYGQTKKKKKKKKRQSTLDSFRAFDKHTERAVQLASSSPTNSDSTTTATPTSFLDTVRVVQRTKGLAGFYIGAQASAAHAFCEKFFYFWSYSLLKLLASSLTTNLENGNGVRRRRTQDVFFDDVGQFVGKILLLT